jgi:uncharacterized protein
MKKHIIITGATGLIGSHLSGTLISKGYEITIFTREKPEDISGSTSSVNYVEWDYHKPEDWKKHFEGCFAVLHLAGASIAGKRFTDSYKKKVMSSRVISTANIVKAMAFVANKPKVFLCASGVNYYGDKGDTKLTESASPGNDFLADVCKRWEEEASKAESLGIRRVSIRTSPVLSTQGGVLKTMLPLFKIYLGGALGNGRQWFPWIHIDDIVNVYLAALENETISGAVNAASPDFVTMNEFVRKLGKVLHRPSFFKVPKFALKTAIGEAADFITAGLKVSPHKLEKEAGFHFKFPQLEPAIKDVIENEK